MTYDPREGQMVTERCEAVILALTESEIVDHLVEAHGYGRSFVTMAFDAASLRQRCSLVPGEFIPGCSCCRKDPDNRWPMKLHRLIHENKRECDHRHGEEAQEEGGETT